MSKTEFVAAMSEKAGLSKKDADAAYKAFTEVVVETLQKGDKVSLVGFGTFEVAERGERKGKNPRTNEEITIPASKAPKFKASKTFKDALNA